MNNKKWRLKKMILPGLQVRITLVFLSLACFAAFFQIYMINRSVLMVSEKLTVESEVLLGELPGILGVNLLLTLLVLVPLMVMVGVLTTHRIAGPIYRFHMHLREIANGGDPGTCRIRKGDELQELCVLINQAIEATRSKALQQAEEHEAPRESVEPEPEPARAA